MSIPLKHAISNARVWQMRRDEVIDFLGGSCSRCGERDRRVLEIDHVNGGGRREHAAGVRVGSSEYMTRVRADPEAFQVLCANCHAIKSGEDRRRKWEERWGVRYPPPATREWVAAQSAHNFSPEVQGRRRRGK